MPFGRLELGLGFSGGGAPAGPYIFTNAEAAALVAAMTVEPSNSRKALIDQTVGALKAANVWTLLDVLQVYAAHDPQASSLNWKNPILFNATVVNMPLDAFTTDRGWTTNGTDSYVDSGFNPATALGSFAQDSASFGLWIGNDKGGAYGPAGGWEDATPDGVRINPRSANNRLDFRLNSALVTSTADGVMTNARGLSVANRTGPAAVQGYKNGAPVTMANNPFAASTPMNSNNLYLGRTQAAVFTAVDVRAVIIGGSIGLAQNANLYSALNSYMTAVGAA